MAAARQSATWYQQANDAVVALLDRTALEWES
jgi:hypothetical protein